MSPVADCNLASYMVEAINSIDKQSLLRTFFGCLCNGLQYLHQSKIRHRDVKPGNILVKGENVLWTDFGIYLDWEDMSRSTTTADSARSLIYCAPEVANYKARNSSSDIWSLGCVFLEMTTILKGETIIQMRQNFNAHSENYHFYANIKPTSLWIENLYTLKSDRDNEPLKWIKLMLNVNMRDRPTAQTLFSIITDQHADPDTSFSPAMFCGLCCVEDDESSFCPESDAERWVGELEEHPALDPYPLSINQNPALAKTNQYSTVLESNTRHEQDRGHGSNDALSNDKFSRHDNNDGVVLSSLMYTDRHFQAAIVPDRSNFAFAACDDNINDGDGDDDDDDDDAEGWYSSPRNSIDQLRSAHSGQGFDCTFPGCDNNKGRGFSTRNNMKLHVESKHQGKRFNCTFPGCDNNKGRGISTYKEMKVHVQSKHQGQRFDCTFPSCDNNKGKGFSSRNNMRLHVRSKHQGKRFNCTFPGCDNNKERGFSAHHQMKFHVRSKHQGKRLNCTFPSCDNNQGKGYLKS